MNHMNIILAVQLTPLRFGNLIYLTKLQERRGNKMLSAAQCKCPKLSQDQE